MRRKSSTGRSRQPPIRDALAGNYREEHVFALTQALELYDSYQESIGQCDQAIERAVKHLCATSTPPPAPLPAPRHTKESHGLVRAGDRTREVYRFMSTNQARFRVATMARVLGVSTQVHVTLCRSAFIRTVQGERKRQPPDEEEAEEDAHRQPGRRRAGGLWQIGMPTRCTDAPGDAGRREYDAV